MTATYCVPRVELTLHALPDQPRAVCAAEPTRATQPATSGVCGGPYRASWYPLGRPVGTTIYPGMQVTSVAIWRTLTAMGKDYAMSLNDVCVFFPAWFGAVATMLVAFLTAECSGSSNSAVGRFRLTVSKPVLKAPMVPALETRI